MVFSHHEFGGHERVLYCSDDALGLRAIIAIHSTRLGPAAGGCRMWPYASEEDALEDALRLSHAMTYKNAMAGLPLGGGKSVIIGDPHGNTPHGFFQRFGEFVAGLGGAYWTAEDVGVGIDRVTQIASTNPYTFGIETGDPSPYTAYGTVRGIEAGLEFATGSAELEGRTVAVQGVGNVGGDVARRLATAGAKLFIADVDTEALDEVATDTGATIVDPDAIYDVDADVFSPCALGASVNSETIPRIRAHVIAGCANNQLAEERDGYALMQRGIVYAPDYVVNSGGMLSAGGPILGHHDQTDDEIFAALDEIRPRVRRLLERARDEAKPPSEVADAMAREMVDRG